MTRWPMQITHVPARAGFVPRHWCREADMLRHYGLLARNYPIRISTACGRYLWLSRRDFMIRSAASLALAIQESVAELESLSSGQNTE